ncbi:hypothetical protein [Aurantiacibacter atlanticus]|nr:hypothetical protein [Aurantiacibacter atlanticus]
MFALLMIARVLAWENRAREYLRAWAENSHIYQDRWSFQAPIMAVGIILICLFVLACWWKRPRPWHDPPQRFLRYAIMAAFCMAPLYALRIVSMHAFDRFLYSGPIRLNWLAEAAIVLAVLTCAVFTIRHFARNAHRTGRRKP